MVELDAVDDELGSVDGDVEAVDAELEEADEVESVVLVCAPPLLLTVTPEPSAVDNDVVPDDFVGSVPVAPLPVAVDPPPVDVELTPVVVVAEVAVPVVEVAADPADDSPADVLLDAPLVALDVDDDPEGVPVVSAADSP